MHTAANAFLPKCWSGCFECDKLSHSVTEAADGFGDNSSPARRGYDNFLRPNLENLDHSGYILSVIAVTGNSGAAERNDLPQREQRAADLQPAGPDGIWPRHNPQRAQWYLRPATTHLMGAPRREPGGSATNCRTYGVLPAPVSLDRMFRMGSTLKLHSRLSGSRLSIDHPDLNPLDSQTDLGKKCVANQIKGIGVTVHPTGS